jgi:hypothetical protein
MPGTPNPAFHIRRRRREVALRDILAVSPMACLTTAPRLPDACPPLKRKERPFTDLSLRFACSRRSVSSKSPCKLVGRTLPYLNLTRKYFPLRQLYIPWHRSCRLSGWFRQLPVPLSQTLAVYRQVNVVYGFHFFSSIRNAPFFLVGITLSHCGG